MAVAALVDACFYGERGAVEQLLSSGADVNAARADNGGTTSYTILGCFNLHSSLPDSVDGQPTFVDPDEVQ